MELHRSMVNVLIIVRYWVGWHCNNFTVTIFRKNIYIRLLENLW